MFKPKAQELGSDRLIQDILEVVGEETEADFDYDSYVEYLRNLLSKPINLNKAELIELQELKLLTDNESESLLRHIEEYGKLITIYELQAVSNLSLSSILRILPFVQANKSIEQVNIPFNQQLYLGDYFFMSRLTTILEPQEGYIRREKSPELSHYLGSKLKFYNRFRYTFSRELSYGFTMEKDAGETFFGENTAAGFDYYSAHFYLRNKWKFKDIALGDYEVKLGQGLILWSGFGFRKGPFVMNVKKGGDRLKPYTSVNETNFLRGAATQMEFGDLDILLFASSKKIDGNTIDVDSVENEVLTISSFNATGFHRTQSELDDKNAVRENIVGASIGYYKRAFHMAANSVYHRFSADLQSARSNYNQFNFQGNELTNASLDYHYTLKNFHFFGEQAISDNMALGSVHGVLASLAPNFNMSLVYRNFAKDYQSYRTNAFVESTRPQNEKGIYIASSFSPLGKIRVDAYYDFFQFPWLRFSVDAPSYGTEYFGRLTYKISRGSEFYLQSRLENKQVNASDIDGNLRALVPQQRLQSRAHLALKVNSAFSIKSRFEYSRYKKEERLEHGFLLYQDIRYAAFGVPLSVTGRIAFFNTQSFDSRIYAYENDVLYSFSIPAYNGLGNRFYLVMKYKVNKQLDLWARVAQSRFYNQQTVGSGLELINDNKRTELRLQLRLKL